MGGPGSRRGRFHEVWPLHGMSYALGRRGVGPVVVARARSRPCRRMALLLSVVLVAELPLYCPRPVRGRLFWAGLQLVGGLPCLVWISASP